MTESKPTPPKTEAVAAAPDVSAKSHLPGIEKSIGTLESNAKHWGDRHKTGLLLIQLYLGLATAIMAYNLAFKEHITKLGG